LEEDVMIAADGRKPRIGILGIMQDLYDEMIPGIAQRQEGYAAELAGHLSGVAEFVPGKAVKYREDAERVMREFEDAGLDGVLVVMLTYGPAMRVARLLAESRLPVCLANIQPEPAVTPAWDPARPRWPPWSRWKATGSGWSSPKARTSTARNCPRWRCPTGSSGPPPGCAPA
jgi:hypothetical protein